MAILRERPWEAEWAKLARQKQACPQTPWQQVAALFERRRGVVPMATRGGRPDLDHLRVADAAARHGRRAVRGGQGPQARTRRHRARRQGHRGHHQEAERPRASSPTTACCTSPPTARWPARSKAPSEPGLILTPPKRADRPRRRLSVGLRGRRPQARRRLGDPVGLQHGGRRRHRARRRCRAWRAPSSTRAPARCWCRTGR